VGDATRVYFIDVLADAIGILQDGGTPFLVIGSIATSAYFAEPWDSASDIDFLMTESDAARAIDLFASRGYSVHVRDPEWIYKAAKPNVTIDLIFRANGHVEMGAEPFERAITKEFEGLALPVPSPEDMAIHNLLVDSEEKQGHWYTAVRFLRIIDDWRYLVRRGAELTPQRTLALLLYARDAGLRVPDDAIGSLIPLGAEQRPA
jgi:hypothetical protein